MNRGLTALLAALGAGAAAAPTTAGAAYLKRPAWSVPALAAQVKADPQLTLRYAKHFQAAPDTVLKALRAAQPAVLPPGEYTVWLTGRDGLRFPTRQTRERPIPVFRLPQPGPAGETETCLERGTGNPIAPFRPVEQVVVVSEPPAPRVEDVIIQREVLIPVEPRRTERPLSGG